MLGPAFPFRSGLDLDHQGAGRREHVFDPRFGAGVEGVAEDLADQVVQVAQPQQRMGVTPAPRQRQGDASLQVVLRLGRDGRRRVQHCLGGGILRVQRDQGGGVTPSLVGAAQAQIA